MIRLVLVMRPVLQCRSFYGFPSAEWLRSLGPSFIHSYTIRTTTSRHPANDNSDRLHCRQLRPSADE